MAEHATARNFALTLDLCSERTKLLVMTSKDSVTTWPDIAAELGVHLTTARRWAASDPTLASLIQVDARRTPHASRKALAAYRKEREKLRPLAPSVVAIPVAKGRAADSKTPATAGLREGGR